MSEIGLVMKASKPERDDAAAGRRASPRPRPRAPASRRARRLRGCGAAPRCRRCRAAGCPSAPGRAAARSASRTPSSPVSASSVAWPLCCRMSRTSFMFFSLSSTIRIVLMTSPPARCCGKREREGRALAGLAVDAHRAAVQLDEALAPAPGPGRCLRPCAGSRRRPGGTPRTPAPAGPRARCRRRCRSPRSRRASLDAARARKRHAAAGGRELDRVRQQVDHDLLDLALVGDPFAEPVARPRAPASGRGAARARAPASCELSSSIGRGRSATGRAPSGRPRSSTGRGCR